MYAYTDITRKKKCNYIIKGRKCSRTGEMASGWNCILLLQKT